MRKAMHILKIIFKSLIGVIAAFLVVYNVWALAARAGAFGDNPTFFGFSGAAVISGSMEPAISVGDFVVTQKTEDYAVGDVITFRDGDTYVTHRIILAGEGFYTTQGDANNAPDPESVPLSSIVGEVVLVLPGMGSAVQFLQSPAGFFAVVGGGIVLWLISDLLSSFLQKREKGEPGED